MQSSDMKNMVVLRNLPSNMVEEAIIIFKENQKVKQKEFIERSKKINSTEIQSKSKDCVLKEAELLVADYVKKIENKNKMNKTDKKSNYKILKYYSVTTTILFVISLIFNFI